MPLHRSSTAAFQIPSSFASRTSRAIAHAGVAAAARFTWCRRGRPPTAR